VKTISATEAARRFSALLTSVEKDGETFVVTRAGRVIARIEPAAGASGATVKALLRRHRVDSSWEEELAATRHAVDVQDRQWPV
jgi:antitoxin (DNA-binding transcriptional repressor) of toxin-antitoxin stability system